MIGIFLYIQFNSLEKRMIIIKMDIREFRKYSYEFKSPPPSIFIVKNWKKKKTTWTVYFKKMILRNAISFLCLFFNFVTFWLQNVFCSFFPLEFGTSDIASVLFLHFFLTPLWFLFWPSYHFQDANDPQPWFTSVSYPRIALPVAYSSYIPYAWFY